MLRSFPTQAHLRGEAAVDLAGGALAGLVPWTIDLAIAPALRAPRPALSTAAICVAIGAGLGAVIAGARWTTRMLGGRPRWIASTTLASFVVAPAAAQALSILSSAGPSATVFTMVILGAAVVASALGAGLVGAHIRSRA